PGRRELALLLANNHNDLGTALKTLGRLNDAEQLYLQAIAMKETLVEESPEDAGYRFHLAHAYLGIGHLQRELAQPEKATASLSYAASLFEKLAAESPEHQNFLEVGHALWNLSDMHFQVGKPDEAEAALRRALDTFVQSAQKFPANPL